MSYYSLLLKKFKVIGKGNVKMFIQKDIFSIIHKLLNITIVVYKYVYENFIIN